MDAIKELLDSVTRIINLERETKISHDERGERFNVFSLCQVDHYEVMHSRILAEFLNPKGMHGQSDGSFLKLFLRMLLPIDDVSKFDCETIVKTEKYAKIVDISLGRFDIYIENSAKKAACIIENKIFAGEQPEQLSRYQKWLKQKQGEGFTTWLIFLTVDGHESQTIEKDCDYMRLAYWNKDAPTNNDIISWLKECRRLACDKPFVRETLRQYQNHIEDIINGGQIMKNKVTEQLIRNPAGLEAAQMIYEAYCRARDRKAEELFSEFCQKFRYYDKTTGAFDSAHNIQGHYILIKTQKDNEISVFVGFENTGLSNPFIGICIDDNKWLEESPRVREKIVHEVKKTNSKWESTDKWPMWRYIGDCMGCPNWDGTFFAEIYADEGKKEKYFTEMHDAIKDIRAVVENALKDNP
ncbi:MAG: PD-(D/E)XK nuclease family protein [Kiritimatiellia bacterium]